jgi:GalNAc-alpha-(1->4)-GalNAc-alpha-(1->3)-diNAcBac-PP-undecaprenol alpha-1,4-N-acetyl-D-galactosaminyltransferase
MEKTATTNAQKTILIVVGGFGIGGSTRRAVETSKIFAKNNWRVLILSLSSENELWIPVPEEVKVYRLNNPSTRWWNFYAQIYRALNLRRNIKDLNPDVILSLIFDANIRVLASTIFFDVPCIVSEGTDITKFKLPWRFRVATNFLYGRAKRVIICVPEILEELRNKYNHWTIITLPHIIPKIEVKQSNEYIKKPLIVAAGRLSYEKGFDLLIKAFAKASNSDNSWNLEIFGDGPERDKLNRLIESLNLRSKVRILSPVTDLEEILSGAAIFALSSRSEGMPNVLFEAMQSKAACISFDLPGATSRILTEVSPNLVIAPGDVEGFAFGLRLLMKDEQERQRVIKKYDYVLRKYNSPFVEEAWIRVARDAIESNERPEAEVWPKHDEAWPKAD